MKCLFLAVGDWSEWMILIVVLVFSIIRALTSKKEEDQDEQPRRPSQSEPKAPPYRPIKDTASDTEEELRKFLEALGKPAQNQSPPRREQSAPPPQPPRNLPPPAPRTSPPPVPQVQKKKVVVNYPKRAPDENYEPAPMTSLETAQPLLPAASSAAPNAVFGDTNIELTDSAEELEAASFATHAYDLPTDLLAASRQPISSASDTSASMGIFREWIRTAENARTGILLKEILDRPVGLRDPEEIPGMLK